MTRERWIHIAALLAVAAGAAWVAKFAVLVATDGEDSAVASALYLLAVGLVLVGSTWIGTRIAGDRSRPVLALLIVLSPLAAFASYAVIDAVAKSITGDAGPAWLEDEVGILATGLVWIAASLPALSPRGRTRARVPSTTRA